MVRSADNGCRQLNGNPKARKAIFTPMEKIRPVNKVLLDGEISSEVA